MESQIAVTSKGRIEYTLLGKGPVILVCHGTSSNCFSIAGTAPLMDAGFSVLPLPAPVMGALPWKFSLLQPWRLKLSSHFWMGWAFRPVW